MVKHVSKMIGDMPGTTREQQVACFLTIIGVAGRIGKAGFIQACNAAVEGLETGQRQNMAKRAENN